MSSSQKTWTAAGVRTAYLQFFEERGHRIVPSSGSFPLDDPTLLFTNAGMNQFKDMFLGTGTREYTRAVDTQKCIRVSGKHNDLEEVGVDGYHHTFFEMLGNWSFGDYFKEEAIEWAWTLLTEVYGLPKERLWVTVYGGDEGDGLGPDEEAERIWKENTDVLPSHVLRLGKSENFWEMGATGPCGPCTEIHIDQGGPETDPEDGASLEFGIPADNERYMELWNLVFMQFMRLDDGSLKELPNKHVDTGLGLERIVATLQGVDSNYHTDLFLPIIDAIAELTGKSYGRSESSTDVAFRVCSDHMRALTAALSDGVSPGNTGRGYVMRRLIRRAARFGSQELGMDQPWLYKLVPVVADVLGESFPEMRERLDHVQLIIKDEETSFGRTLNRGIALFDQLASRVEKSGATELPGADAFELYATSGFPQDLVEQMARERELTVDLAGWEAAESKHKNASKGEGSFKQLLSAEELESIDGETVSTYHDKGEACLEVSGCKVLFAVEREPGLLSLVLDTSPFYAESGGQAGDTGTISSNDGNHVMKVTGTKKVAGVVVHLGKMSKGTTLAAGCLVDARVAGARRELTAKNHSATHLLNQALREVLGDHVAQQGSEVDSERLRFDFSNPKGLTPEEIDQVEAIVNRQIIQNSAVEVTEENLDEARARGVVAAFGEKYGERVRVVDMGAWSTELCGGTHVQRTGDIGAFTISQERAISAGVRRIEGLTGPAALAEFQEQRRNLRGAATILKTSPAELQGRLEQLQKQLKEAKKKQKAAKGTDATASVEALKGAAQVKDGVTWVIQDLPGSDSQAVGEIAEAGKALASDLVLVLFGRDGGKVPFVVVSQGSALEAGHKAGDLAKMIAGHLGGGGGGRPGQAQGRGLKVDGVAGAIEELSAL